MSLPSYRVAYEYRRVVPSMYTESTVCLTPPSIASIRLVALLKPVPVLNFDFSMFIFQKPICGYIDGTSRQYSYATRYDGKDMPVTGNSPYGNTTAMTHVDANTTRTVYKNKGQVTVIQTSVVSADRKTRTVTTKGTNPAGQSVDNLSVYDRQ